MGEQWSDLRFGTPEFAQFVGTGRRVPHHGGQGQDEIGEGSERLARDHRLPRCGIGGAVGSDRQCARDGDVADGGRIGPAQSVRFERGEDRFDARPAACRHARRCGGGVDDDLIQLRHGVDQHDVADVLAGFEGERAPTVHRSTRADAEAVDVCPVGEADDVVGGARGRGPHRVEPDGLRPVDELLLRERDVGREIRWRRDGRGRVAEWHRTCESPSRACEDSGSGGRSEKTATAECGA